MSLPAPEKEYDSFLSGHVADRVSRILLRIYITMLAAYGVLIISRLFVQDFKEVSLLLMGLAMLTLSFLFLLRKKLRAAVFAFALVLLVQVALITILGQGIRDLAVVSFPAILVVASLILNRNDYIVVALAAFLTIFAVSLGPVLGLYTPLPPPGPGVSDFVIVLTITALSAAVSFFVTQNMKESLHLANREIAERKKMAARLEHSLDEKNVLIKEIHHRVKNNLSVVNSLLSLQKNSITSARAAREAFDDMRTRIFSISEVHQQLYRSDSLSRIKMAAYINSMVRNLKRMAGPEQDVSFAVDIDDVRLSIDRAIPCGIIINELVTNSLKHAFNEIETGRITITLKQTGDGSFELEYGDNGPGFGTEVSLDHPKSLGLKLINLLVAQIDGSITTSSENGASCRLHFPVS